MTGCIIAESQKNILEPVGCATFYSEPLEMIVAGMKTCTIADKVCD